VKSVIQSQKRFTFIPEDGPIQDRALRQLGNSELIDHPFSDTPLGPEKWHPFASAAIFSPAKIVEAEQDLVLGATLTLLVRQ